MKVWLIENERRYFQLLHEYLILLKDSGDPRGADVSVINAGEAFDNLQYKLMSEAENSIQLVIVVDGEEIEFLSRLSQVISRCPTQQNELKIIIVSNMVSWSTVLPRASPTDLGGYFFARKPPASSYDSYEIENVYSQLEARRKIRSNLVLLGTLYGGDGLDFNVVLRHIWSGDIVLSESNVNISQVIPAIHYKRFLDILVSIFSPAATFGYIVPAFDWNPKPFVEDLQEMYKRANLGSEIGYSEERSWKGPWENAQAAPWSIDISKLTGTIKISGEMQSSVLSTFAADWNDFLTINGFIPLSCVIAGPPKSGKTALAKSLSEKLQLTYIDIPSSVLAVLQFDEKGNKLLPVYDLSKMLGFQGELKTLLEAKQSEGKKGSKDKTPVEPGVIDLTLLNEAYIMQNIPVDLLRKAVSFHFCSNHASVKKGFILDFWEKNLLEDFSQIGDWKALFLRDGMETTITPIDVIVELLSTEKILTDKQIEVIGPANMKSKESQATIKNLETQLTSYFTATTELQTEPAKFSFPPRSHQKIVSFEADLPSSSIVHRLEAFNVNNDSIVEELRSSLEIKRNCKVLAWLNNGDLPIVSPTDNVIEDVLPEKTTVTVESIETVPVIATSSSNKEQKLWNEYSKGICRIDEFLTAAVLPILSKGLIDAVRNKPDDPIMYIANYLAEISQKQQEEARESARKQFEELLIS